MRLSLPVASHHYVSKCTRHLAIKLALLGSLFPSALPPSPAIWVYKHRSLCIPSSFHFALVHCKCSFPLSFRVCIFLSRHKIAWRIRARAFRISSHLAINSIKGLLGERMRERIQSLQAFVTRESLEGQEKRLNQPPASGSVAGAVNRTLVRRKPQTDIHLDPCLPQLIQLVTLA